MVTDLGWTFLRGEVKIPSGVVIWDKRKKFQGSMISISNAMEVDNWQYEDYVLRRIPVETFNKIGEDRQMVLWPTEFHND